jgi:hypothetical protein
MAEELGPTAGAPWRGLVLCEKGEEGGQVGEVRRWDKKHTWNTFSR